MVISGQLRLIVKTSLSLCKDHETLCERKESLCLMNKKKNEEDIVKEKLSICSHDEIKLNKEIRGKKEKMQ